MITDYLSISQLNFELNLLIVGCQNIPQTTIQIQDQDHLLLKCLFICACGYSYMHWQSYSLYYRLLKLSNITTSCSGLIDTSRSRSSSRATGANTGLGSRTDQDATSRLLIGIVRDKTPRIPVPSSRAGNPSDPVKSFSSDLKTLKMKNINAVCLI